MTKLPPIEKIYEAWTALADHRVDIKFENPEEGYADVSSSDGQKAYVVKFSGNKYSSDDNATYWRGYAGYPVIAVMMLQGKLPFDEEEAAKWSGINWTRLNKEHRNNYGAVVAEVCAQRGIDATRASEAAQRVMDVLATLPAEIKRKI